MNTFLIRNGSILTMDEHNTTYTPGWVWVEGDRITAVGPGQPPVDLMTRTGRLIDATHMVVMPGLVNGHTRLEQTLWRGLAETIPQPDRLVARIQAAMTPGEMYLSSLLGLVANLHGGVTSVVQHQTVTNSYQHVEATLKAAQSAGVRLGLARGWSNLGTSAENIQTIIGELTHLYDRWHQAEEGRITIGLGPPATARYSERLLRRTVALARQWGITIHLPIAETRTEVEQMRQRYGWSPTEWLHVLGLLGPDLHLVHCVHVADDELDLIATSGAMVVHCPGRDLAMGSSSTSLGPMLDRGIPVALGTGGSAWPTSPDLLETVRLAALLSRGIFGDDPPALLPLEVLRMVTNAGAWLLGQADLGRLVPGAKADLTLINLNTARSMPVHDPASALVYHATGPDVHTVIVDGRVLLEAGRVTMLDEVALLAECREAAERLLARVGAD